MTFQESMDFLLSNKIRVGALITDRHTSIARHIRDDLKDTHHYFDLWHLKKSNVFNNLFSQKSQRKVVVKHNSMVTPMPEPSNVERNINTIWEWRNYFGEIQIILEPCHR